MMESDKPKINIAYIDAANLDKAMGTLGWKLDYAKFRVWLKEKYKVEKAYIFIGMIKKNTGLYNYFQESGFAIVFKDVLFQNGTTKGNCDSDLLMKAASDFYEGELDKAILVASDGDYAPLVKMLNTKNSMEVILSPARANKCSILLKRTGVPISYIGDQRSILKLLHNN